MEGQILISHFAPFLIKRISIQKIMPFYTDYTPLGQDARFGNLCSLLFRPNYKHVETFPIHPERKIQASTSSPILNAALCAWVSPPPPSPLHSLSFPDKEPLGAQRNIWKLVVQRVTRHFIKCGSFPNRSPLLSQSP